VNEPTSRLNLIQRAMQRAAPSRGAVHADHAALQETNGWPQGAFSEQKAGNGAPSLPRFETEPAQFGGAAEPVHLDYAKLRASRIITPDDQSSAAYNEFRSIKRKLIPMTCDPETGLITRNLVMVTSALPREGKTFTAMNLAICLAAERNLNVILVDGDVVRGSIAEYFQCEEQSGLVELMIGRHRRIDDVLHPCFDVAGLHVIFAGKRHQASPELLASRRMADICTALSKHYEQSIVIFDAPPVLAASEPAAMAAHVHHLIMLIAAGQAGRHQVEAALTEVSRCPSISLLFNRSPHWERPLAESYYYHGDHPDKPQGANHGDGPVAAQWTRLKKRLIMR
jgi:protein-tyrosine kinase